MVEPGEAQDLRHLRHVPEHVGEVADAHRAAELRRALDAELQVAHERLRRHHELVHEDRPRADLHAPGGDEAGQPFLGLGPHLEVVVDHDRLAVEQEALVGRVGLEEVEQVVDEVDELDPVGLERRVPLPVPVRVGDDPHLSTGDLRHTARVREVTLRGWRPAG